MFQRNLLRIVIAAMLAFAGIGARAALLTGSFINVADGTLINLSTNGPFDWAHWGWDVTNVFNHKSAVLSRIAPATPLGTNALIVTKSVTLTGTNGSPIASGMSLNAFAITV